MIRWLNKKLKLLWVVKQLIPVIWKHSSGEMYCFRDVPYLCVRLCSIYYKPSTESGDDALEDFFLQAKQELRLRHRQMKRNQNEHKNQF